MEVFDAGAVSRKSQAALSIRSDRTTFGLRRAPTRDFAIALFELTFKVLPPLKMIVFFSRVQQNFYGYGHLTAYLYHLA
jgi:hypothetical protein